MKRTPYPSDVSDDEWSFVAPYLTLMTEEAPQREHDLREVFNGLRWIVRTAAQWRMMPHDLPPWAAVDQQTQRWLKAGVFEAIVETCVPCCDWRKDAMKSLRRPFLIVGPCNRVQKVGIGQAMMEPSGAKAAECIWRSIPWGICWPCMSPPPTSRIASRWANWLPPCKK